MLQKCGHYRRMTWRDWKHLKYDYDNDYWKLTRLMWDRAKSHSYGKQFEHGRWIGEKIVFTNSAQSRQGKIVGKRAPGRQNAVMKNKRITLKCVSYIHIYVWDLSVNAECSRSLKLICVVWVFWRDADMLAAATWLAGWVAVCHSQYCIKTTIPILKLFRPSDSPIIEAFGTPCADTKFQGEPLHQGRLIHGGRKNWRFSTDIAVYLGNGVR